MKLTAGIQIDGLAVVMMFMVTLVSLLLAVLVLVAAAFGAAVMLLLGISREVNLRWRHRAVAQQLKAAQSRFRCPLSALHG